MKPPKLSKLEPQKQSLETDMTKHFCLIHLQRRKVKHNIYSVKNKTCLLNTQVDQLETLTKLTIFFF